MHLEVLRIPGASHKPGRGRSRRGLGVEGRRLGVEGWSSRLRWPLECLLLGWGAKLLLLLELLARWFGLELLLLELLLLGLLLELLLLLLLRGATLGLSLLLSCRTLFTTEEVVEGASDAAEEPSSLLLGEADAQEGKQDQDSLHTENE